MIFEIYVVLCKIHNTCFEGCWVNITALVNAVNYRLQFKQERMLAIRAVLVFVLDVGLGLCWYLYCNGIVLGLDSWELELMLQLDL